MTITLETIQDAARQIRGALVETPCRRAHTLSELTGARVALKFENLQFTASFKERGALVKLLTLSDAQRRSGVIAMSAGNHAQALAYHAQRLGIPATIVMPRFTPNVKVEHTRNFGADVVLAGENLRQAAEIARELADERGLVFVHPYDDEDVIRGQGTIALEMLDAIPQLEVLIVPVGGGGLIAGIAIAAQALNPDIEIVGVQAARFPAMKQALEQQPSVCGPGTLAEGIAVEEPGALTLPVVRERVSEILLVEEVQIEEAILLLLEIEKSVVEGAGAAGLAALRAQPERFAGREVGLILSGGNIDPMPLSSILQRGLVRSARLARLEVALPDEPGALARVARTIGEADGNIVEVHHQRAFTDLPLQSAEVVFVIQTRGAVHLAEILSRLSRAGIEARRAEETS